MTAPHRFGEVRFELAVADPGSPLADAALLARHVRDDLLAGLAEGCAGSPDACAATLVLDLGAVPEPVDWPALRARLAAQLRAALAAHSAPAEPAGAPPVWAAAAGAEGGSPAAAATPTAPAMAGPALASVESGVRRGLAGGHPTAGGLRPAAREARERPDEGGLPVAAAGQGSASRRPAGPPATEAQANRPRLQALLGRALRLVRRVAGTPVRVGSAPRAWWEALGRARKGKGRDAGPTAIIDPAPAVTEPRPAAFPSEAAPASRGGPSGPPPQAADGGLSEPPLQALALLLADAIASRADRAALTRLAAETKARSALGRRVSASSTAGPPPTPGPGEPRDEKQTQPTHGRTARAEKGEAEQPGYPVPPPSPEASPDVAAVRSERLPRPAALSATATGRNVRTPPTAGPGGGSTRATSREPGQPPKVGASETGGPVADRSGTPATETRVMSGELDQHAAPAGDAAGAEGALGRAARRGDLFAEGTPSGPASRSSEADNAVAEAAGKRIGAGGRPAALRGSDLGSETSDALPAGGAEGRRSERAAAPPDTDLRRETRGALLEGGAERRHGERAAALPDTDLCRETSGALPEGGAEGRHSEPAATPRYADLRLGARGATPDVLEAEGRRGAAGADTPSEPGLVLLALWRAEPALLQPALEGRSRDDLLALLQALVEDGRPLPFLEAVQATAPDGDVGQRLLRAVIERVVEGSEIDLGELAAEVARPDPGPTGAEDAAPGSAASALALGATHSAGSDAPNTAEPVVRRTAGSQRRIAPATPRSPLPIDEPSRTSPSGGLPTRSGGGPEGSRTRLDAARTPEAPGPAAEPGAVGLRNQPAGPEHGTGADGTAGEPVATAEDGAAAVRPEERQALRRRLAGANLAALDALLLTMLADGDQAPLAVASRAAAAASSAPEALLRLVIEAVAAGEDVDLAELRARVERRPGSSPGARVRRDEEAPRTHGGGGPALEGQAAAEAVRNPASQAGSDDRGVDEPGSASAAASGPQPTPGEPARARPPLADPSSRDPEATGGSRPETGSAALVPPATAPGAQPRAGQPLAVGKVGPQPPQAAVGNSPAQSPAGSGVPAREEGGPASPARLGTGTPNPPSAGAASGRPNSRGDRANDEAARRSEAASRSDRTTAAATPPPELSRTASLPDAAPWPARRAEAPASDEARIDTDEREGAALVPDGSTAPPRPADLDWNAVAHGLDGQAAEALRALLGRAAAEDPVRLGRVLAEGGRGRPDRFAAVAGLAACEALAVRLAPGAAWMRPAAALLADAGAAVGFTDAPRVLGRSLIEEALTGRPSAAGLVRRLDSGLGRAPGQGAGALAAGIRIAASRHPATTVAPILASLAALGAPKPAPAEGEAFRATRASGLVIVAPHLPALFERLGVTERGRIDGPEAAARALDVLAAVLHGPAEVPGAGRVLERLLCGLPADLPLPPPLPLEAEALATVEAMLGAVIAQWAALGQTSVEGLREAFLRRDGLLRPEPAGHRLEVSPKAYDMLLDRLPWPIGVVKTRWMEHPLHVVWRK